MIRNIPRVLVLLVIAVLGGCGANHHSIYRSQPIDAQQPILTMIDAKQRVIIASPVPKNASTAMNSPSVRFCAEPSPDVFSVLAQSASASGSFGQGADPAAIQAALSAAYSSAEQGSTIGRTQTINLLKEAMYRTCERLINGFAGELETSVQAVRDQRLMIATLAIEQLTDATRPSTVTIGANSAASGGSSAADGLVRLDDAYKALQGADAQQKQRQAAYDAIKDVAPACSAIASKVGAGGTIDATETAKQKQCAGAESALAEAKTARQAASAHYETLKNASQQGGIPVSASSTTQGGQPQPNTSSPGATTLEHVAAAVQSIVEMNYQQDEFLLLCLKVLEKRGSGSATLVPQAKDVTDTCITYVQAGIRRETALADAKAAEVTRVALTNSTDIEFAAFLAKVETASGSNVIDPARLAAVIDGFIASRAHPLARRFDLDKMKTLSDVASLRAAFARLPTDYRQSLSQ